MPHCTPPFRHRGRVPRHPFDGAPKRRATVDVLLSAPYSAHHFAHAAPRRSATVRCPAIGAALRATISHAAPRRRATVRCPAIGAVLRATLCSPRRGAAPRFDVLPSAPYSAPPFARRAEAQRHGSMSRHRRRTPRHHFARCAMAQQSLQGSALRVDWNRRGVPVARDECALRGTSTRQSAAPQIPAASGGAFRANEHAPVTARGGLVTVGQNAQDWSASSARSTGGMLRDGR